MQSLSARNPDASGPLHRQGVAKKSTIVEIPPSRMTIQARHGFIFLSFVLRRPRPSRLKPAGVVVSQMQNASAYETKRQRIGLIPDAGPYFRHSNGLSGVNRLRLPVR